VTTFPDLSRYVIETSGETLSLPINGITYEFTADLSLDLGLRIMELRAEGDRVISAFRNDEKSAPHPDTVQLLDDQSQAELFNELIGPDTLAEMKTNGVRTSEWLRVGETLFAWHMVGPDAALHVWTTSTEAGDAEDPPAETPVKPTKTVASRRGSTTKRSPVRKPRKSPGRTSLASGDLSKPTSSGNTTET
jgi:hypothetical protein